MMEWKDRFPSYSHTDPFQHGSKYPPVTSRRDRSRYAAVFQDQYGEFSELQREVGATQAKLQQLEALLLSLPPPRSQVSPIPPVAQLPAPVLYLLGGMLSRPWWPF